MGVLEDCLEFLTMAGQGKVVLRTGSAAAPLDAGLTSLIETTVTSGDVSVFLPMDQAARPGCVPTYAASSTRVWTRWSR